MNLPNAVPAEPGSFRSKWELFRDAVTIFCSIAAFIFLCIFLLAQLDTNTPVEFKYADEHVTTMPEGKAFFLERETCLHRDIGGVALPGLRSVGSANNIVVPMPMRAISTWRGCVRAKYLIQIPDEVPPGEYTYNLTFRFQMNPFKQLDVASPPVRVTVTK